jgi:hypothetical protein
MLLQPSYNGRKYFNLDQIPHSSSEETEAQNGSETYSPEYQVSLWNNNFALQQHPEENPLTFL